MVDALDKSANVAEAVRTAAEPADAGLKSCSPPVTNGRRPEFTSIDQRIALPFSGLKKEEGSWAIYYNFDQYVWQPEQHGKRGIGLFGRFGASDGNPNLMQYFFSLGVAGKGPISCRPHDQFGLGYHYLEVESPTLQGPLQTRSFLRDELGFEAYYTWR